MGYLVGFLFVVVVAAVALGGYFYGIQKQQKIVVDFLQRETSKPVPLPPDPLKMMKEATKFAGEQTETISAALERAVAASMGTNKTNEIINPDADQTPTMYVPATEFDPFFNLDGPPLDGYLRSPVMDGPPLPGNGDG